MAGQIEAVTAAMSDRYAGRRHPDWPAVWRTCWRDAITEEARQARGRAAEARHSTQGRCSGGAIPGHSSTAANAGPVTRGGGALYDRVPDDPDPPRRYRSGEPVYAAWCAREALADPASYERVRQRGWVALRRSEVEELMAGRAGGSEPLAGALGAVLVRAARLRAMAAEVTP
jgi:hypothetical protein